jgi:hypothetical protein
MNDDTMICTIARMAVCLIAAFGCAVAGPARADAPYPALNLSSYKLTFDENFKTLDISAGGPGTTWIAHTPWNGDFGAAAFGNPGPDGPFSRTAEGLAITARQDAAGKWQAGLICSRDHVDARATGFAQQYGYFEMKAKLPDGPGVWPAFWLEGVDHSQGVAELDVMEYYGHDDASFRSTEHVWVNNKDQWHHGKKFDIPPGLLTKRFNIFGVLIGPDRIVYYFNREPYWSTPTPPSYRQKMFILANLAIGGGWPYDQLPSPRTMDIAYIHVYQKNWN